MTHVFLSLQLHQTLLSHMFGLLLILTLLDNHHILNFC